MATTRVPSKTAPVKTANRVIPIKPVTSWSFSRYNDYKQCPLKFKLKHIDKLKEPPSAAMERGNQIHTMAEAYVKGQLRTMPPELKSLAEEFKELKLMYKRKQTPMVVEDQWAFTSTWELSQWNDWNNCWLRVKLDNAHTLDDTQYVTDWKTGKYRDYKEVEYNEQLELYATAGLSMAAIEGNKNITVVPRLGWLDEGFFTMPTDNDGNTLAYTMKDLPKLQKLWSKRVTPMFNDKHYPPKPNNDCKWCHFRKSNGGVCQY